jgi:hypothetical protein
VQRDLGSTSFIRKVQLKQNKTIKKQRNVTKWCTCTKHKIISHKHRWKKQLLKYDPQLETTITSCL